MDKLRDAFDDFSTKFSREAKVALNNARLIGSKVDPVSFSPELLEKIKRLRSLYQTLIDIKGQSELALNIQPENMDVLRQMKYIGKMGGSTSDFGELAKYSHFGANLVLPGYKSDMENIEKCFKELNALNVNLQLYSGESLFHMTKEEMLKKEFDSLYNDTQLIQGELNIMRSSKSNTDDQINEKYSQYNSKVEILDNAIDGIIESFSQALVKTSGVLQIFSNHYKQSHETIENALNSIMSNDKPKI
ncbi:MAG: hypothetical protein MHPSP_000927 [Paramarteilia canceri]